MALLNKRLIIILLITTLILVLPFLAMLFTDEVKWSLSDFTIAGLLLYGTGLLIELILRKTKKISYRTVAIFAIVILFLLIWVELAVGIVGSPFAGN